MKFALVGEQSLLIECARQILDAGHEIVAVVADAPRIRDWGAEAGLHVLPATVLAEGFSADVAFDWLLSIANLRIIPDHVLARAAKGAVNFHDGPLPAYAGLNTPVWALLAGERRHGITWHRITPGIDRGEVLIEVPVEIEDGDTAFLLNTKCFMAGRESFAALLTGLTSGTLVGRPQDFTTRRYFAKRRRPSAAGVLDVTRPVADVLRLVRALDFGRGYANPLLRSRLLMPAGAIAVASAEDVRPTVVGVPGTILSVDDATITVSVADGAVRLGLADEAGERIDPRTLGRVGDRLPLLTDEMRASLDEIAASVARHEEAHLAARLQLDVGTIEQLKPREPSAAASPQVFEVAVPASVTQAVLLGTIAGFFSREAGQQIIDVAFADDDLAGLADKFRGFVATSLPLRLSASETACVADVGNGVSAAIEQLGTRRAAAPDLPVRYPDLPAAAWTFGLRLGDGQQLQPVGDAAVTVVVKPGSRALALLVDTARLAEPAARAFAGRLELALTAASRNAVITVGDLPRVSEEVAADLVHARNATDRTYDRDATLHELISAQVARTPDAIAVVGGSVSLTYAQLDARAEAVAAGLVARGIGPDTLVGVYMPRSADLVVAALAVLKAGGAYVPLDPTYPADRIALMIEDSGCPIVLTETSLRDKVPAGGPAAILTLDAAMAGSTAAPSTRRAEAHHLAYVIYTSGSTGRPKGVMVEHRNVLNFCAGMDDRIPVSPESQPVWLAVTSLSFDISVLELFWTLTRGFKVVVHADDRHAARAAEPRRRSRSGAGMDFSLFYWGNDDGPGPRKYQLLLEGARFADAHGFRAVWTPERHFHAFGGPYPNPAVTGAAIAAVTKNLEIRAGSCVLPLHHPARVAEEWAVIDNLSNGRAGLAFAAGWMPEDFLLRPENAPPHNKAAMFRDIETVRKLWRGEKVNFEGPTGSVAVMTQPRPVQAELPVWVTTAGNPETYREAARAGANVLTHLLGQSIAELADKIKIYHDTLRETGRDPADYTVTLMLHTLIGDDHDEVRERARGPMKDYLRSAAALIKQYAWAFPAFKKPQGATQPMQIDLQTLSEEELDAILEFAFLRYFDDSGLFGTVEDALARVADLKAIGVDEIACLIDFGIASDVALRGLEPLAEVVAAAGRKDADADAGSERYDIAALVARHAVTHLQCTPSMAAMLLVDEETRRALGQVRHLFLGGEALQASLVRELRSVTQATIDNMYGPTETTIWSSTARVGEIAGTAPLGTPIANTQLYILDDFLRLVPPGSAGELYIGGDGVTRGYLGREELTRERFLADPFRVDGRMYKTGDLVRIAPTGEIEFLGRADFQVKVRGYRIELGEIEARLAAHPGISEAVVITREDTPGDVRIVAYLRQRGAAVPSEELRDFVRAELPEFMVPAHFVSVATWPLTPNAKIDRKALPKPGGAAAPAAAKVEAPVAFTAPAGDLQQAIAEAFKRALGVERVGGSDNFFALGGHSLLAVQVHRDLKQKIAPNLTITDLYRFPTVAALAEHVAGKSASSQQLGRVADRAAQRRSAMAERRTGLVREAS